MMFISKMHLIFVGVILCPCRDSSYVIYNPMTSLVFWTNTTSFLNHWYRGSRYYKDSVSIFSSSPYQVSHTTSAWAPSTDNSYKEWVRYYIIGYNYSGHSCPVHTLDISSLLSFSTTATNIAPIPESHRFCLIRYMESPNNMNISI